MKVSVCRKERFNAAHRLNNPDWDEAKNKRVFGKCNHPNYHGHNYVVYVKIKGEVDKETGYVMDMKKLGEIVEENVVNKFDHRNLNLDIDDFQNLNPTTENLAYVIWSDLREKISKSYNLKIILYESETNFVEYEGE